MAILTLTRTSECAAKNHIDITVPGDASYVYHGEVADILAPITDADKDAWVKVTLRLAKIGRTNAQLYLALTAGHSVTI